MKFVIYCNSVTYDFLYPMSGRISGRNDNTFTQKDILSCRLIVIDFLTWMKKMSHYLIKIVHYLIVIALFYLFYVLAGLFIYGIVLSNVSFGEFFDKFIGTYLSLVIAYQFVKNIKDPTNSSKA